MKTSALLTLLPGWAFASDILSIALHAKEARDLHNFIRNNANLDYGCRPVVMRSDGEHKLHALVSSEQLDMLKRTLDPQVVRIDMMDHLNKREEPAAPIGKGDRFQGGKVAPRGLGSRKPGEQADLGPILNVNEIHSAMKALSKKYGIETFVAPYKTYEGQTVIGGVANRNAKTNWLGSIRHDHQYIFLNSGIHARERGGPDNLIYFISDLLYADAHGTGLTYGKKSFTKEQVSKVLDSGIVFIPLSNPDGVRYDQANGNLWRKNRNPQSSTPGKPKTVGVDLNRNFDFLWNFTKYFDPSVEPASSDPADEAFYGTAPFSEPETKNIRWVYEKFPKISWFIDVHSAAGTLLYSWGDDVNQANDPKQNLFNPAYDGKRGPVEDSIYKEYISEEDWYNVALQANRTTAAMKAVGGREYVPQQAVGLYPTSGASDDWSFSRWHGNKKLNKVYGYTMEFGYPTNFYPTAAEYVHNILDTNAGFMEFILNANEIGLKHW
ncbi:zinc carboxypeptidase A 1 precursor [Westerdykella ornata]|uniref:Zinc carboxypeptidase A 1 n=1 Tax=Westerdykella ornata TaxID=318751 RepID=A0A6A6JPD7_WESOR|nr:zinc carboxypeptidase A 1 precursor [Westerdykella ornata]KAF2278257.1 zinc carboxypeptidase A 1 precursor [Westerdykella ornata]